MMVGWDVRVCNYVDRIPRNVIYGQSERVVLFSVIDKQFKYRCQPRSHKLPSPRIYVRGTKRLMKLTAYAQSPLSLDYIGFPPTL
jgi:hypothetical protein